jgi:hypothetical protein
MKDSSGKFSRRTLMQRMGLSGSGLLVLGSSGLLQPSSVLAAISQGNLAFGGTVALELDGATTWVRAFEGGNAVADVLAEQVGAEQMLARRPGAVNYEDMLLKLPLEVAPTFASWIQESLSKGPTARSGAMVFFDINRVEWKRLEFSNAIISEIALPTCDAGVSQSPQLTVRLTPEATRWLGGSTTAAPLAIGKSLKASPNFRLNIKGLEGATQFVSKIEGIGVKRLTQSGAVGQLKLKQLQVGALDVQPIKLALAESKAAPFYSWFESFVIKGRGATGEDERPGLVEWLSATGGTVVASVQLQNLGIVRYAPEPYNSSGADKAPSVQVELYCERLTVSLPA